MTAQVDTFYFEGKPYTERPKIGLALSGGAAHGFAHIGVLKYMEEQGIPIDYITGTSMGAIIGGLKSMGYNSSKMEDVISKLDWGRILSNDVPLSEVAPIEKFYKDKYKVKLYYKDRQVLLPQGIFTGHSLDLLLTKIYFPANYITSFDDLPIPFRCYAVDIINGKIVEMKNGSMARSIRASMAIPSVFTPELHDGKLLVDGGLIRNFPVSNNADMGSDLIIGSYVGSFKPERTDMISMIDILRQSAFLRSIEDSEEQALGCHIYISPDVKHLPLFKFEDYKPYMNQGYLASKAKEAEFKKLKAFIDNFPPKVNPKALQDLDQIFITRIDIPYGDEAYRELIAAKFGYTERSYLTMDKIAEGISKIYATNNFEKINYAIRKKEDGTTLLIEGIPRKETTLGIGVNYFKNTNASAIVNFSFRNILARLSHLSLTTRISDNPAFQFDYFIRSRDNKNYLFKFDGKVERLEQPVYSDGELNRIFRNVRTSTNIGLHFEPDNFLTFGLNYGVSSNSLDPKVKLPVDIDDYFNFSQFISSEISYNSINRIAFPQSGWKFNVELSYHFYMQQKIRLTDEAPPQSYKLPTNEPSLTIKSSIDYVVTILPKWTSQTTLRVGFKSANSLTDNFNVGGTANDNEVSIPFLGALEYEIQLKRMIYTRQSFQYSLIKNFYLGFAANYVYGSSYIEQLFLRQSAIVDISRLGYGIYLGTNTPIGPIILDVGFASGNSELRSSVGIGFHHIF